MVQMVNAGFVEEIKAAMASIRAWRANLLKEHAGKIDGIIAAIRARENDRQVAEIKKSLGIQ